ncbi:hypothetical protein BDP81DRAFT_464261 [Colletotrichum phormii]|uniref:SMP-30/Gluconolactonase/LRE-like region domain-containing protein n=1 Tax=Colletotrichum phormii TaxID=359342 RepID=A0AAJ0ECR3_9PEZI|nr:uncharacterized protein BDP81DRAFT_464261 [Colletotrichum phormii]KAK1624872.1 hypothetical protein BDP81DRAFT_464261 [Colletotrichum phormii]
MMPRYSSYASLFSVFIKTCLAQNNSIVSIPYELTYLLPPPFHGNLFHSFVNGTNTSNASTNELLQSATNAPFISYDDDNFAGEAGVWISDRNEVWYTTWINDGPTHVEILDLNTKTIRNLTSSKPLENPNGDSITEVSYWLGGVVSVEPETGHVETVLNSYFSLRFDSIDDVAWVTQPGTNNSYMFITVLPFAEGSTTTDRLPQGLWRWDPQNHILLSAISRTEFPVANGVRPSRDQKTLWVTDFGGEERSRIWGLPAQVGVPAIYSYELNDDMWPVNKRIFGASRMQAPDGIRIDDQGRVWTGEGEGVMVRSSQGKVVGVFNGQYFTRDPVNTAIVQFELAGDVLVVLGQNKLWTVKLAEMVNSA